MSLCYNNPLRIWDTTIMLVYFFICFLLQKTSTENYVHASIQPSNQPTMHLQLQQQAKLATLESVCNGSVKWLVMFGVCAAFSITRIALNIRRCRFSLWPKFQCYCHYETYKIDSTLDRITFCLAVRPMAVFRMQSIVKCNNTRYRGFVCTHFTV